MLGPLCGVNGNIRALDEEINALSVELENKSMSKITKYAVEKKLKTIKAKRIRAMREVQKTSTKK